MKKLTTEQLLQLRLAQEEVVTELGIAALSGKPLKEILQEAVQSVHDVLAIDYVSILEYIPSEKKMLLRGAIGWKKDVVVDKTRVDAGKGSHAGYTLWTKRPVIIKDLALEKRFRISSPLRNHPAKSGISCVIYGKEIPYGVLTAHSKRSRAFSKDDINLLQSVANLIALTIEKKRLEAQKDEFISIASHELKTPVTSLKAYTQVLRNRFAKAGDIDAATLLTKMDTQLDRLTNLITDLLDATKIQKGKLELSYSYFDFNELIGEIVEEMQRTTRKQTLVKDFGRSKTVHADRERIGQVLTNFLSNAIKYSPHAKKIEIKTWSTKESISASVQDFGIGIPKENHQHLFERFFRVNDPDVASFPGLGLGLFISSEIIQRHKGKIWVESEKGEGSTFGLSIPIEGNV